MSIFDKLRKGLARTRDGIVGGVAHLVPGRTSIDSALLDRLEEILIASDVGTASAAAMIGAIRERVRQDRYQDAAGVTELLKLEARKLLGDDGAESSPAAGAVLPARPYVILVVGINGAGKTTSIGKLARMHARAGRKVLIAAADTFRAAANEQLEVWAERAGAEMIRQPQGSDPAAVAFDAARSAAARGVDVLIIDTAGRLHTRVNLMEELRKIRRVVEKQIPGAPHEVLLVVDASTGQNGLQQAKQFGSSVSVTGIILTKLDGTAKGGIVLAIGREMHIPVRYIGIGEQLDDLEPFDPATFVEALFAP